MFSKLRNYSKIIIIIIAAAMVITGGLMGYGAYLNRSAPTNAPSPYVAKVNNTNITQQEYYAILRNQAPQSSQLTRSQIIPFKLSVLDSLIEREVILQNAEEMQLKPQVSDKDVEDYINKILEANEMTKEELVNNLENQGIKYADLERDIKKSLEQSDLIKQVREKSYSNVTVTEEEIQRAYEQVHPLIIIKGFKDDQKAAEEKIREALSKIKAGTSFADVAKEYSDIDNSDLGFIGRDSGYLPEEVIKEAFALKKGEVSEVITGPEAYYLIKVVDKKLATGKDYEEAKAGIKDRLLKQKQSKAFNNWLENAKAEAEIEILDPTLKGYEALRKGNYELAVQELAKALEMNPLPSIYTYLAHAYHGNKQLAKALETYDKAIEEYPDDWELHFSYGNFLAGLEDPDKEKALAQYDKASELAGEDFMAHYQLYLAYNSLEAEEKAQAEMDKLKEIQEKIQKEQEELQKANKEANSATSEDTASSEVKEKMVSTEANNKQTANQQTAETSNNQ